jgi:hypothetical protein
MRLLAPGVPVHVGVLRVVLFVLPLAALALALPDVPGWLTIAVVVVTAGLWARTPDHVSGAICLAAVALWWGVHGVVDWRLPVVAVLLLVAHLVATVLSYGPPTLAVDPRVARLWAGRGLLVLVPVPIAWLAVRGLDPDLAPSWTWLAAGIVTVVLLVATARLTQAEAE